MNIIQPSPSQQHGGALNLIDRYVASDLNGAGYGARNRGPGQVTAMRAALYRQRWTIILSIALTLLAAGLYTMLQAPIYRAEASLRIDPQGSNILEGQDLSPAVHVNEYRQYLATLGTVVGSRKMAETVAANLKLGENPAFLPKGIEASRPAGLSDAGWQIRKRNMAAATLQNRVDVDIPIETRVMTISYRSAQPQMAAQLANGFAEAFLAEDARRSLDTNTYALDYLTEQIADIRGQLQAAELASNAYARKNRLVGGAAIVDPVSGKTARQTTISAQTLASVNAAYTDARASRIEAEQRWRSIANLPAAQLPQVHRNPTIQTLLTDKTKAQAELADLRERYEDGYPAIQELRARIGALSRQIVKSTADIKASLRNDYRIARQQENALKAELGRVSDSNQTEQDLQVRHGLLERDAAALEDQLTALLARYNALSSAANLRAGSITLLDAAVIPIAPISPDLTRNLLIGLIAGFGLAIMLSVLREALDDGLRSASDLERGLGLSLLGQTPFAKPRNLHDESSKQFRAVAEAYATICSSIDYAIPRDQNVLQLTSSKPSEGKSTSALMIAKHLARAGQKILLVDADLRRPSLHTLMRQPEPEIGLLEILNGHADLPDAFLSIAIEGLDVIGVSPTPSNPSELLSSHKMADFITKQRGHYDRIILDSSPVMGIADAPLIAGHVDATIFVAEAGRINSGQAEAAVRRLRGAGANIVGAILTKFRAREAGLNYATPYSHYTYAGQE
jgi:capsular exopolysaccharide synthesis family protein